jgi:hypothetical protein
MVRKSPLRLSLFMIPLLFTIPLLPAVMLWMLPASSVGPRRPSVAAKQPVRYVLDAREGGTARLEVHRAAGVCTVIVPASVLPRGAKEGDIITADTPLRSRYDRRSPPGPLSVDRSATERARSRVRTSLDALRTR